MFPVVCVNHDRHTPTPHLLPLNYVVLGFREVADKVPDSIDDLIDYFRDHLMKNVELSLWNMAE